MNINKCRTLALICVSALAFSAASASVNKSITIEPGERADGATSVNGSVRVGEDAVITGDVKTVNGSINIADNVQAQQVKTVNGRIRIGDDVKVESVATVNGRSEVGDRVVIAEDLVTVNGVVVAGKDTRIGGNVEAVNGRIELNGARVAGDVENYNGGMELLAGTRVAGSVYVRKPKKSNWSWGKNRAPRIVIGEGVVIVGELHLEREVELFVHESAKIGKITGVEVEIQTFSGARP